MNWNDEDLTILKENYGKIPTKKLAAKLKRSEHSIRSQAGRYGLQKNKTYKSWTYDEDLKLYTLYHSKYKKGHITIKRISKLMHRTITSIENRLTAKKLRYFPPDPNAEYNKKPGRKKYSVSPPLQKDMMFYKIYNTQLEAGFIKEAQDEI